LKILIVEDYGPLRLSIAQRLREEGYSVDDTADGEEGLWFAKENDYAVALLDINLPSIDGLTLLSKIRKLRRDTSVIMITARDSVSDRIAGLDGGADDYLVKPFELEELVARVRAMVRRRYGTKDTVMRVGDLEIDTLKRVAARGGEELGLTQREFALLELLALRTGQVVSRRDVWEQLYDFGDESESNVVDVFIAHLRKKIEREGKPKLIHTRRGEGYVLEERT
jgi:DNA-binding response OmpR family regulator